ncbi:MAG: hypothetical protein A2096_00980 [Spirochaetes bacterium GWF1_41_5]|nr:MAG: hypothetical protein A2096_00980 [Spirochaetes bacterium GWF1_41_5]HBE04151.1 hypothetical protein [Spirochaetia bacterium]
MSLKKIILLIMAIPGIFSITVWSADAEKILLFYDDFGLAAKSPHLVQGEHLASWSGKSSPEYSVAHHKEKIIVEYRELDPAGQYELAITFLSTSERIQKLTANDEVIYDNVVLPSQPAVTNIILPSGIAKGGMLRLEFINIKGVNTVIAELSLLSIGAQIGRTDQQTAAVSDIKISGSANSDSSEKNLEIISSLDQKPQKALLLLPKNAENEKRPLLVALHSWGGNYLQKVKAYGDIGLEYGFYILCPDYRGPNGPAAKEPLKTTGSKYAVQDIADAVEYMKKNYLIDEKRIYLVGASGGGHMALLMAGKHPHFWAAISAWCPISDLAKWYEQNPRYRESLITCLGGAPGTNSAVNEQYRERSPIHWIDAAWNIPLQIVHGTQDNVVPVSQSEEIMEKMRTLGFKKAVFERRSIGHTLSPRDMIDFVKQHRKE